MELVHAFGAVTVAAMALFYALEQRSAWFILLFAAACLASAGYAAAIRSWPFATVELLWAGVATHRWVRTGRTGAGTCGCDDVCSLPSDQLRDRLAMMRREILPRVTRREDLVDGAAFEFEYSAAMHKTLDNLVVFERACCSDLSWNVSRRSSRLLRLTVQGIPPDSDLLGALGRRSDTPVKGGLARLVVATGLGTGLAALLCCVVPVVIASVGGASAAASMAKLDDPLVIAGVAVVLAIPSWFWLRHRAARSTEVGCKDGC